MSTQPPATDTTQDTTQDPAQGPAQDPAPPVLRIITPDASPDEVAALVAVFAAMGSDPAPIKKPTPAWSAHHRRLRPQHPHGPGGWRASGLPR